MDTLEVLRSYHFLASQDTKAWDKSYVGCKALGLRDLPLEWTPPFFVLPADLHSRWIGKDGSEDWTEEAANWLRQQQEFVAVLEELAVLHGGEAIVRSSSPLETLQRRGQFESIICPLNEAGISLAVAKVLRYSQQVPVSGGKFPIATVVQAYIAPVTQGHLSNERRVSRSKGDWLREIQPSQRVGKALEASISRFRVDASSTHDVSALSCDRASDIDRRLREVASRALLLANRCHFEWLWDGSRLWVVQADQEEHFRGSRPGSQWPPSSSDLATFQPAAFVPHTEARGAWHKIECLDTFHACGLPEAEVFVLEDADHLRALAQGTLPHPVQRDLNLLTEEPIVIRSDVSRAHGSEEFLLPRTDLCRSTEEATGFLVRTARHFQSAGVPSNGFCFIVHRFIASTACAFSLALPGNPLIRIDATWGLPDGLLYYPHDSFEIDVMTGLLESRVRCKTDYLDVDSNGTWVQKPAGEPWDWRRSVTKEQIEAIGQCSFALAEHLDRAVETMFFVGVWSGGASNECLPWFYTDAVEPGGGYEAGEARLAGARLVTSEADLQWVDTALSRSKGSQKLGLRLRPAPELLRSRDFIDRVAEIARRHAVAVELEGSMLQHAYYLLKAYDIRVKCVEPFEPKGHRRRFGKLVRDFVPRTIRKGGERVRSYRADEGELERLLRTKALEEAFELFWSSGAESLVAECVDILEVIEALCRLHNVSSDDLRALAAAKRAARGGFAEGVVLLETRTIPLSDGVKTDPALFEVGDEEGLPRRAGLVDPRPARQGRRLLLPFMPPPPEGGKRGFTIRGASDEGLEVSYSPEGIAISFRRRATSLQDQDADEEEVEGQLRIEGFEQT